jgi:hypothetical protein
MVSRYHLIKSDYLSADAKLAVDTFGGRIHVE